MSEKQWLVSDPSLSTGTLKGRGVDLKKEMNEIDLKKNPCDMPASS